MSRLWKDRNVLITGYEGFVGSHLTRKMLSLGARVYGLDILTRRKHTILTGDLRKIRIIKGDVADYGLVDRVIRKNKIDFIFHLAATSIVGQAVKAPLKAFSDNIRGTWNVLEASRQSPSVEGLIVASSDKAYGSHNKLPYTESSALCGEHPYDASKSCADILARAYFVTYGAPVCVTRCGNIFGPGDFNFSRIIPDAIRSILKGKTLVIRSDGKFVRDYIYIKDIISGYLALAEKMLGRRIRGEAFNFSNESPLSVLAAVKLIARLCGRRPDYKITDLAKHEIKYQYLCADKARKMLGWSPAYKLEDGLRETIAWYRDYLAGRY